MKKILSLILVFALTLCISTSALAAEPVNRLNGGKVEKHTIEFVAEPGVSTINANGDEGIMPIIWNQFSHKVPYNANYTTGVFSVPDRYFAFEVTGTDYNGSGASGYFSVNFLYNTRNGLAGLTCTVNGPSKKADWITIPSVGEKNYSFEILNGATGDINVTITYYSWA